MANGIADDLRKAFGDQTRTETAPDLGQKPTGRVRDSMKSAKSATRMPSMTVFQGLMGQISKMPNKIFTKAIAADEGILPIVRPYMAGDVPLQSVMVPLVDHIVKTSGKPADEAVVDFLRQFGEQ